MTKACEDVQRYLRDELNEIKLAYPTLKRKREWPTELEFTQIATAAGGLFAYASTVVRYIGDPHYGDPAAQLCRVLETVDDGPKDDVSQRDHPMAQLDALYKRILSVMIKTKIATTTYVHPTVGLKIIFASTVNKLGLTEDAAYGAVRHLYAVVKVPAPDQADDEGLEYLHPSFSDFLFDFERSGFSQNIVDEIEQLPGPSFIQNRRAGSD